MLSFLRLTVISLILFLLGSSFIWAQDTFDYSRKKNNFGFILGANYSMLEHDESSSGRPYEAANVSGFGFGLGLAAEIKLVQGFYLAPSAVFSVRDFDKMDVSLQCNANFEYKFDLSTNEPYLILGGAMDFPIENGVSSNAFTEDYNMSVNLGFGFSKWFKFFMFAPELVYSHGFRDLQTNPVYDHNLNTYIHQLSHYFKFIE